MQYPSICFICRGDHTYQECPDYPRPPDPPSMFKPREEPKRSSLALTQFEERYGRDALQALAQLLDDPEITAEQQTLAIQLIEGAKTLRSLTAAERETLDALASIELETTEGLANKRKALELKKAYAQGLTPPTEPQRSPRYISTWQEMQEDHPDLGVGP